MVGQLCKTSVLFILGVIVVNMGIAVYAERFPAQRKLAEIREGANSPCVGLGNSLMASGFDADVFTQEIMRRGAPCASVNGALGATEPVEHLMLLDYALRYIKHPQLVVYGFYDFQLTDPPTTNITDLEGNRAIGLFLDRDAARKFYNLSPDAKIEFELLGRLPMFVDRGNAYQRVELLRRELHQVGRAGNGGPRANDVFTLLEADSEASFVDHCVASMRQQSPLSPPIDAILREATSHGARVVIVLMPMPTGHVKRFYEHDEWRAYVSYVRNLLERDGATLIDASDWIPDSEFADVLHLDKSGALEFSTRLADSIAEN